MADIEVTKSKISGEFAAPSLGHYSGDYSFAGMFLARAALDSSVICVNLCPNSEQNGTAVLDILRGFGAKITRSGDSVNVRKNKLHGCNVNIAEFPQIAPVIALLALFATGKTRISGFAKCQDLQKLIIENLQALGAKCEYNYSDLWIWPQHSVSHSVLNARNHPYMALALILISTYTSGTTVIRNIDGLINRYPEFMSVFENLGGKAKICSLAF